MSQLKWGQNSYTFEYNVTEQKHTVLIALYTIYLYNVQVSTKYTAWFLRYNNILESWTWKHQFPTRERPLINCWKFFTCTEWYSVRDCAVYVTRHAEFRLTTDFDAEFPMRCMELLKRRLYRTRIRDGNHLKRSGGARLPHKPGQRPARKLHVRAPCTRT